MKRTEKIGVEISRAISNAIAQTFDISESGVFTIRNIDVLNDYSQVRVWISRIGGVEDFFERLSHAHNRIKRITFENISLMKTPQLVFIEDFTGEYAQNLEEIMKNNS